MPTITQDPIDIEWGTQLTSAGFSVGLAAAIIAATALSAANANALVNILIVDQVATAATALQPANISMPSGSATPQYFVQLDSAPLVYPLETARVAAYALSAANGNAPVNICRSYVNLSAP